MDTDFKAQADLIEGMAVRRINPTQRRQLLASAEALRGLAEFREAVLACDGAADLDRLGALLGVVVGLPTRS